MTYMYVDCGVSDLKVKCAVLTKGHTAECIASSKVELCLLSTYSVGMHLLPLTPNGL